MGNKGHVYRNQRLVNVGAADGLFLTENVRRRALIISGPPVGDVFISFSGAAALNEGLCMYNKAPALLLTQDMMGDSIREEIRCIGSVGGQTIGVVELAEG